MNLRETERERERAVERLVGTSERERETETALFA